MDNVEISFSYIYIKSYSSQSRGWKQKQIETKSLICNVGVLSIVVAIDWYHDDYLQAGGLSGLDIFCCVFCTFDSVGGD